MSQTASEPLTPETVLSEALAKHPTLNNVLMQFHIGGCTMCGFEREDTIQKVGEDNGVPPARLAAALNDSIQPDAAPN